ncbi:MAG: hypothetical protein PHC51_05225 [bacterium]|nr:hypothetical protein [bacterium]
MRITNHPYALFIALLATILWLDLSGVQAQRMPSFRAKSHKNTYEDRYIAYMEKQEKQELKARQQYEKDLKKAEEAKRRDDMRKLKKELAEKNSELVRERKAKSTNEKKLQSEIAELKKRLEKIEGKPARKDNAHASEVAEEVVNEGNTVEQVQLIDEAPHEAQSQEVPPTETGKGDDFFNEIQPETENEPVIVTSNEEVLGEKKQPSTTFLGKLKRALW